MAATGGLVTSHGCVSLSGSTSLQNAYDNATPGRITVADGKDLQFNVPASGTGKVAVQRDGTDNLTIDGEGNLNTNGSLSAGAGTDAGTLNLGNTGQNITYDSTTDEGFLASDEITAPSFAAEVWPGFSVNGATFGACGSGQVRDVQAYGGILYGEPTCVTPSSTMQATYDISSPATVNANVSGRHITYNLTNLATDPNFLINVATSSTSKFATQYNGADTFSITNAASAQGSALFKNATNNTTAFQIQNSSAQNVFRADTSAQKVAVGPAAVPANGALTVGTDTTAATGGMYFGTDTNLYRSAADTLKTDDALVSASKISSGNGLAELSSDGNGALELGATGSGTPFIDFHYGGGGDYNVRLINDNSGRLAVSGSLHTNGNIDTGGTVLWNNGQVTLGNIPAISGVTLCVPGGGSTVGWCSSSKKYKKDIKPLDKQQQETVLDKIDDQPMYTFKATTKDASNQTRTGFLAEELPENLIAGKDPEGAVQPDWNAITAYLWQGEKDLSTQVKDLQRERERLETKADTKGDKNAEELKKLNAKVDELAKRPTVTASGSPVPVAAGPATGTSAETQEKLDAVTKTAGDAKAAAERVAGDFKTFTDNIAKKIDELSAKLSDLTESVDKRFKELGDKVTGVEKRQGEADAKLKQLEEQQKKQGDQSPAVSSIANGQADEALQNKVNDLEKKVAETAGQAAAQVSAQQNAATQAQIAALQNEVKRLQAAQLSDSGASVEQVNRVTQGSAGPYPTPDLAVPAVAGAAAGGGVAAQVQGAGAVSGIGIGGTSDGKLISDASHQDAFDLSTTKEVKDGNLLVVKNKDKVAFAIDQDGKITSQSVTTASIADKAVTTSKLAPNQIEFRVPAGADIRVDGSDFADIGQSTDYTAGDTDESLILNARLMAKNDGGQGVGARLVYVVNGVETECNESFTYQSDYSTLAVPCTVNVPAKTKVTIKWQVKVGDGGTAVVFRQTDKASPYINGFAAAR